MRPEYPITLPLPFLKLFHIIIFFIHCIHCIVSIWYQTNLTNFIHGSYSREPTVIARPLNPPVTCGRRSSLIGNRRVRGRIRHGNSIWKIIHQACHDNLIQQEATTRTQKHTFNASPRLGLQDPTSREFTVFVTRTFGQNRVILLTSSPLQMKISLNLFFKHLRCFHHPRCTVATLTLGSEQLLKESNQPFLAQGDMKGVEP